MQPLCVFSDCWTTDNMLICTSKPWCNDNKLLQPETALNNIHCHWKSLQWIPAHCDIEGNEQADKMIKIGAEDGQEDNTVSPTEMKTLFKQPERQDSYYQLSIFSFGTGHCRLIQHLHQKFCFAPSPTCHCGEADQTVEHILQHCQLFRTMREEIWTEPVPQSSSEKRLVSNVTISVRGEEEPSLKQNVQEKYINLCRMTKT